MSRRRVASVLVPLLGLAALALLLAPVGSAADRGTGKPKVYPEPAEALPSPAEGCDAGTTADGVTTIPIKVDKNRVLVNPLVNVCFDGKGPYPMLIDTGASESVISTELAEELGLKKVGPPGRVAGAGCTTSSQTYELPSWSVGGVQLEGTAITTVRDPEKVEGRSRGSLGADVLSRFGAARIDFRGETLVLRGPEGPPFERSRKSGPTPAGLVKAKPELTVPMQTSSVGGQIRQSISVKVGSTEAEPRLIDTGSSYSFVDAGLVREAKLKATGTAQRGDTYCSIITVPEYRAPSLSLGSGRLKPQTVAAFAGLSREGHGGGVLGSYSLWQFGSVVFDWARGNLLLGAG